ncbi:hypothetical protein Ldro_0272 [Legionella drozanskii LLAP-1]|uniref:Uncharacterized protein n=1 Tax=Legionella drozanskii LLAP-1 TaxID=1212489 RepID=A0A0W0TCC5_9GAMM|nr:hypothetical protein Ldro_0272 [Legionella drozanskii LLAP-1]PJE12934.1 MAG: hypothetical protein CK430_06835 [Legionella sp.]
MLIIFTITAYSLMSTSYVQTFHMRLIDAELRSQWSDHKYETMTAYFEKFVPLIPHVNDDLEYFRNTMS